LQVLDLALVLLPSQFQLYQWMFVVDRTARFQLGSVDIDYDEDEHDNAYRSFQPHLKVLSTRPSGGEDNDDVHSRHQRQPTVVELDALSLSDSRALRRPVLPLRRLQSLAHLLPFHVALSKRMSESALRPAIRRQNAAGGFR
jgi:hypothetical protein